VGGGGGALDFVDGAGGAVACFLFLLPPELDPGSLETSAANFLNISEGVLQSSASFLANEGYTKQNVINIDMRLITYW
jgi:hypothetical protein